MAPTYLEEKFIFKPLKYNIRKGNQVILPKPNTENCRRTFLYRSGKLYNNLPLCIRQLTNFSAYRKEIREKSGTI